ncbi:MAG: hypothetical protein A2X13_14595 [Bacteroidetes bacterium GWC2_33_15]|nr:MAG: hypothetical protein A2X10_12640 [Bacteroidetes bacterium GWA2_33_15]OFX50101.1 MAG: hypothetical protein A2X13_14595 [Bacteroidetes bacterium GWC2_33_15]OFX65254.1 MAG: hypothetical protein A2X15_04170 [Bacteroidetes bacterium GWB2_32_14]OFX70480.1 MAG: hypothetical protein A2X14_04225 [Bacteroidetes bacterium GWD2_33_33]HAN19647.1 hypothetical protein [Bacteroidales bacterium]
MQKQLTRISASNKSDDIISKETEEIFALKQDIYHKRLFIKCTYDEFLRLVTLKGERIFREQGQNKTFDIDNYNNDVLTNLYYYAVGDSKFSGDLLKGLWFWSEEFGTGKTTIMDILRELFNDYNNKVTPLTESKILHEIITRESCEYFRKRVLYFDDLGREIKEINDFGTKIKPIPIIIHLREHEGSWTHITAQRPILQFEPVYGSVTINRMIKMFNEIEFKGKTRRK